MEGEVEFFMTTECLSATDVVFKMVDDNAERCRILAKLGMLRNEGLDYELAPASLELFVLKEMGVRTLPFKVISYHVSQRGVFLDSHAESVNEAIVKVSVQGKREKSSVSDGNGAVNALDLALRAALEEHFPILNGVGLVGYSVESLNGGKGSAAKTRVLIKTARGEDTWTSIGVSEDSILASLTALVDGIEYAILEGKY